MVLSSLQSFGSKERRERKGNRKKLLRKREKNIGKIQITADGHNEKISVKLQK